MNGSDAAKIGQLSEPGEYDPAMLELLQLLWGDGFLSPGGSDDDWRQLVVVVKRGELRPGHLKAAKPGGR